MKTQINTLIDQTGDNINMITDYANQALEAVITWLPSLVFALLTLIIGFWIAKRIVRLIDASLAKREADDTLRGFIQSFLSVILKLIVIITAATMLGVKTASLIAMLGAAGLAVGLALQGSLSNFAGGVLILFFRPFKAGDYVKAQDAEGFVEKIQIFSTILRTVTNESVVIPNGALANGVIENYSSKHSRRVDFTFGIGYNDSIDEARATLLKVIEKNKDILQSPAPEVYVSGHGDSAVELLVRVWVKAENYFPVNYYMWEEVKKAFDAAGISIPYPQQDVHMHQVN